MKINKRGIAEFRIGWLCKNIISVNNGNKTIDIDMNQLKELQVLHSQYRKNGIYVNETFINECIISEMKKYARNGYKPK